MLLSPPPPPPAFQAAGRAAIPRRVAEAAPPVLDRGCFSPSPGVRAVVAGGVERRKRGRVGGEWYGGTRRGGEAKIGLSFFVISVSRKIRRRTECSEALLRSRVLALRRRRRRRRRVAYAA